MRVSILHWNRPAECIATIIRLRESNLPLQITVVDNCSKADRLAQLRRDLPPEVELTELPENVGWGRAHNVVLRKWLENEHSEYCIVSAHDALPVGACLEQLLGALSADPEIGMACPEYGTPEIPRFSVLRGATVERVEPRKPGVVEEVEFCHGTLAIFRRSCLAEIGVFNEDYFAYGDEAEIGIRARTKGWKVGLVWGAILINPGSWSGGPVIAYLWTRNSIRLAAAFGGVMGCLGRTAVILAGTARQLLKKTNDDLCFPGARLLGIIDFFRGYKGAPTSTLWKVVRPAQP